MLEKEHLRYYLLFAFQLKKSAAEAQDMICAAFGEDAVSYSTCTKWFQRFKCGNFDLHDNEPPVEKEELERLLEEDPCRTPLELAEELGVTHQAVSRHLRKLGRIQKEGCWVPGQLTDENKSRRYETAMSWLSRFKMKDWYKIIICDEKWILYNNPKRQKSWDYASETSTNDAKPNIYGKKVLLSIWWDQQGVIYCELLNPGETVTAERYQKQLIRFRNVLNEKRPYTGEGKREVILLHDNIWPHTSKIILKKSLTWIGKFYFNRRILQIWPLRIMSSSESSEPCNVNWLIPTLILWRKSKKASTTLST